MLLIFQFMPHLHFFFKHKKSYIDSTIASIRYDFDSLDKNKSKYIQCEACQVFFNNSLSCRKWRTM